jgi:hypothetical protein
VESAATSVPGSWSQINLVSTRAPEIISIARRHPYRCSVLLDAPQLAVLARLVKTTDAEMTHD